MVVKGSLNDFVILADPVSLGMEVRARHDVLLVMCLCLSSRHDGRLYTPMLSAPAMPLGSHGGNAMVALMLQTLAAHPASLGRLRVGHGAPLCESGLTCGGPDHIGIAPPPPRRSYGRPFTRKAVAMTKCPCALSGMRFTEQTLLLGALFGTPLRRPKCSTSSSSWASFLASPKAS